MVQSLFRGGFRLFGVKKGWLKGIRLYLVLLNLFLVGFNVLPETACLNLRIRSLCEILKCISTAEARTKCLSAFWA